MAGQPVAGGLRVFVRGTRFFIQCPVCAGGVERLDDLVADAAEAGLVAAEAGQDTGFVEERAEGEGRADFVAAGLELLLNFGFAAADFDFEEGGLERPNAVQAPAGGDQLLDEVGFEGTTGLKVEQAELAEGAEVLLGLVLEEDAAGGEAWVDDNTGLPIPEVEDSEAPGE